MASAFVIWSREERKLAGPAGQTFPTSQAANDAVRRLVGHSGGGKSDAGSRTFDVLTVTVP